ncbi:DUF4417 domain-containing protein [Bremerella sp. T1]|uniref:DUF4417 domain-containing protein n=1 Tax=Bremerella sp. TYQ1 TaxID=3119568 RepID=UPI001CCF1700|nr:DUF4417 domain-containing protein [Bremerella volcania]UBM36619.1 DUF4417 domain-containing protein [Bremerella volcania]
MRNERALLSCFDQFCCGDSNCDNVCPNNPQYATRVKEIGGFGNHRIGPLQQQDILLPNYIPLLHHGSNRKSKLVSTAVAVSPYDFLKLDKGLLKSNVADQASLRQKFGISDYSKLVMCGTSKDKNLEKYWTYRRRDKTMDVIAAIGPDLYIAPNFSMFLDVPRTDNLFNIKRQLLCLSELSASGVSVVPHISATMIQDWINWCSVLEEHNDIEYIAFNFQTGYSQPAEGLKAVNGLKTLQQHLGRRLSLILIGGSQFVPSTKHHFREISLIDSNPFMKTQHRRRFQSNGPEKHYWIKFATGTGELLDDLLQANVDSYGDLIARKAGRLFN